MRRICLSVVGLILGFFYGYAQSSGGSDYKNLDLKLTETNIITGYYSQAGNHSPVTGGIGTQKLTDISNVINLKFVNWDIFDRKHTLEVELGVDHHTAASSAYVSKTGASRMGGTRIYPSLTWSTENSDKKTEAGIGASYSGEYTYHSYGINAFFTKRSKDDNREFSLHGHLFVDRVKMVEPSELRPVTVVTSASRGDDRSLVPSKGRNTLDATLSLSQVVNQKMQFAVITDLVAQQGYLGLPFHRVYFNDGSVHIENMPSTRFKLPLGFRFNYFAGDKVILRSYYRYYTDSWGVSSHTASLEVPVKLTSFVSVSPFYRYYTQTAARSFAPYGKHTAADNYYTSNYDYSAFNANYAGVNFRISPVNGVFGVKSFSLLELRYGFYEQTTGLKAQNLSMNLRFK